MIGNPRRDCCKVQLCVGDDARQMATIEQDVQTAMTPEYQCKQ